jgi:hypothetical protein
MSCFICICIMLCVCVFGMESSQLATLNIAADMEAMSTETLAQLVITPQHIMAARVRRQDGRGLSEKKPPNPCTTM